MPPHYSSASYAYAVQYRRYTYCWYIKGKSIFEVKVKVMVKVIVWRPKICIFWWNLHVFCQICVYFQFRIAGIDFCLDPAHLLHRFRAPAALKRPVLGQKCGGVWWRMTPFSQFLPAIVANHALTRPQFSQPLLHIFGRNFPRYCETLPRALVFNLKKNKFSIDVLFEPEVEKRKTRISVTGSVALTKFTQFMSLIYPN